MAHINVDPIATAARDWPDPAALAIEKHNSIVPMHSTTHLPKRSRLMMADMIARRPNQDL